LECFACCPQWARDRGFLNISVRTSTKIVAEWVALQEMCFSVEVYLSDKGGAFDRSMQHHLM
jgi:hypothetical protein